MKIGDRKLEMTDVLHLGSEVDVDAVLHVLRLQSVGFDVLLHVVSLYKSSKSNKHVSKKVHDAKKSQKENA